MRARRGRDEQGEPADRPRMLGVMHRGAGVPGEATIGLEDLRIVAAAASARLPNAYDEERRLAVLGELTHLAREVGQAQSDHTRHLLAEYRGSRTAWDLAGDSDRYCAALARYADLLGAAAGWLRPLLADHDVTPRPRVEPSAEDRLRRAARRVE